MIKKYESKKSDCVFLLYHVRKMDGIFDDPKFIGPFLSKEAAENCIKKYKKLPGFKSYPEDFLIVEETLDKAYWSKGFKLSTSIQIKQFKDWRDNE